MGNGKFKTVISQQPLHYRSKQGYLKDIELNLQPISDGYQNVKNIFETRFLSDRIQLKASNNEMMEIRGFWIGSTFIKLQSMPIYNPNKNLLIYSLSNALMECELLPGGLRIKLKLSKMDWNRVIENSIRFQFKLSQELSVKKSPGNLLLLQDGTGKSEFIVKNAEIKSGNDIFIPLLPLIKQNNNDYQLRFNVPAYFKATNLSGEISLELTIESIQKQPSLLSFVGIYKEYVNSNYTGINSGSNTYVGNYPYNDSTEHRYRSAQYWNVESIPDNAVIDSARFKIDIFPQTNESFNISFNDLDNLYPSNLNTIYDDCSSGTTYDYVTVDQGFTYTKTFNSNSSFSQDIKNSLSRDWFGIGFYTSLETDSGKYASLTTYEGYLEIYYYNPSIPHQIIVTNSFGGGFYKVIFQGDTIQHNVPDTLYLFHGEQAGLLAVNQDYGNYFRVFHYWETSENPVYQNPLYITATGDASYEAKFKKRFEITLDNNFIDGGSGGYILVNDTSHNVPYLKYVLEGDTIKLEAPDQPITINGRDVNYLFQKWSDGSTENPRILVPSDHIDLSAIYKGHLVSNKANATAFNSARHIAVGSDSKDPLSFTCVAANLSLS